MRCCPSAASSGHRTLQAAPYFSLFPLISPVFLLLQASPEPSPPGAAGPGPVPGSLGGFLALPGPPRALAAGSQSPGCPRPGPPRPRRRRLSAARGGQQRPREAALPAAPPGLSRALRGERAREKLSVGASLLGFGLFGVVLIYFT